MATLRIADVINDSIVDGPGLRFTIFTQGCPHHCKGCHNPQTHDFTGGRLVDTDEIYDKIVINKLLSGVTYSGGEPFVQAEALLDLSRRIRTNTNLNIIIYTGYTYEQLRSMNNPIVDELLSLTYLLIDGPYIEELRDLELQYRGSGNQRLLYLNKSN